VKQNRYKLLVVDIDGTLLNKNGSISTEDKKALSKAVDSGIQVSLSTGRVVQASLKFIQQLSLGGYHIFFDGALVYNPEKDEEVYVEPINWSLVRQTVDYAKLNEINLEFFSKAHFFIERETWVTDIRRDFFGLNPTIVDFTKLEQNEMIIKGGLVVSSAEEKTKANDFCLHFKDRLNLSLTRTPAYPDIDFFNLVALDVSKGNALKALASFLKIPLNDVVAIGDGTNDIPLLSSVGLAIAMDNAADELKEVADYVTLDVDHNGVAAAITKFLL
jgi:Cof subfamily protein (haloacid dehalogenase superfamily)